MANIVMGILFILQLAWTAACVPVLWPLEHYQILPLSYKYIIPILNTLGSETDTELAKMLFRNFIATFIYIFVFIVLTRIVSGIRFVFCVIFAPAKC